VTCATSDKLGIYAGNGGFTSGGRTDLIRSAVRGSIHSRTLRRMWRRVAVAAREMRVVAASALFSSSAYCRLRAVMFSTASQG
jgi:hypothetical protein